MAEIMALRIFLPRLSNVDCVTPAKPSATHHTGFMLSRRVTNFRRQAIVGEPETLTPS
jgi:hypothetical protein